MSIDHCGTPIKTSARAETRTAKRRPAQASPLRHPWLGTGLWSHRAGHKAPGKSTVITSTSYKKAK